MAIADTAPAYDPELDASHRFMDEDKEDGYPFSSNMTPDEIVTMANASLAEAELQSPGGDGGGEATKPEANVV